MTNDTKSSSAYSFPLIPTSLIYVFNLFVCLYVKPYSVDDKIFI